MKNVTYTYPVSEKPSLDTISLVLEKGKIHGIVGANGSGKTTLCNVLIGFCPGFYNGDFQGDILLDGESISGKDTGELITKIGYIFQNPYSQISGIKDTVYEEIAYGLENLGVERQEIIQRVDRVVELLGIEDIKNKNPFELSGGQQQKVAFASVIVMDPEILIIDEPVSQLDPQSVREIYGLISYLKDHGKTIILVEQKLELLLECADDIAIMKGGKVLLQDTLDRVVNNPIFYHAGLRIPDFIRLYHQLNHTKYHFSLVPKNEDQFMRMLYEVSTAKNCRAMSSQLNDPERVSTAKNCRAMSSQLNDPESMLVKNKKMPFIQINNVSYGYSSDRLALDSVSLTIEQGESIAIIGQNGAGKTTLAKLICGLIKPSTGSILINDRDTRNDTIAQCAKTVGYVFQNPDQQLFEKSIEQELRVGPKALAYDTNEIEKLVAFALNLMNLSEIKEKNPYDFSLAIRKIISIASVLSMNTEVIIMDEPTAGQDQEGIDLLKSMLKRLREMNKTIIVITHDMEFAAYNFQRILVMADKNVISDSGPYETFSNQDVMAQIKLKEPFLFRCKNEMMQILHGDLPDCKFDINLC